MTLHLQPVTAKSDRVRQMEKRGVSAVPRFLPVVVLVWLVSCFPFSEAHGAQPIQPLMGPPGQDQGAVMLSHFNDPTGQKPAIIAPEQKHPPLCPLSKPAGKETLRLKVTGAELHCSEDDCSHHHHGCKLEIMYSLSSGNHTHNDIGASVVCNARLNYITSHGYRLQSERCSNPMCHTLQQHARIDSKIILGFQFSPYEQVVDARVDSIQCHIENAEILRDSSANQLFGQSTFSQLLFMQPR